MRLKTQVSIGVLILALAGGPALADDAAIKKWIDTEFQPSTLSKDDQTKELQWFAKAAEPYKGMEINVVSETLTVHKYESEVLAKAFEEITGIKIKHDIIQEGDVVEKIQTQMQSGKNVYDGWINNSDFIGTHPRYNQTVNLSDWMAGEAKGRHGSDAGRRRLHRQVLHHMDRQEALPAAGPAVRELVLVPVRLVHQSRHQGQVQSQIRLRARRASQLVGLRRYRGILHQRHQGNRRCAGLWPHGLWQEGSVAWVALHRRLVIDGGQRGQGHSQRHSGRRMGHPHGRMSAGWLFCRAWRRRQWSGLGLCDREIYRLAEEICAASGARHDVLRGRPRPCPRQRRPADLLVHSLHRRHGQDLAFRWSIRMARRNGAWLRLLTAHTGAKE